MTLLTKELSGPNGIAFSPDEKYLYVDNWDLKRKVLMRYEVNADGTSGQREGVPRLHQEAEPVALDGIKVDVRRERLRVGSGGRLDTFPGRQGAGTNSAPGARRQLYVRRQRREVTLPDREHRPVPDSGQRSRNPPQAGVQAAMR